MPIFLDRHHMQGTTATEVAVNHLKDLEVQGRYGVRFLTYWFDEERGTTFCLIDAPDKETAQRVHREAHGDTAGDMIDVDLSAVEAFLGRIGDPKPAGPLGAAGMDPAHRAIMFTDIVGSTAMTARLGDVAATELIRAHDSLVRRALARHDGREVKHLGDGIMAAFGSVTAAVNCGRAIQQSFERYNQASVEPIHIRIGLDCGEPIEDSRDLFGATVQRASRLCSAAETDQILASASVSDECGDGGFTDLGCKALKGFQEPVRVFACNWRGDRSKLI